MPNIRIKDIPTTASATVNGDFFAVDSNASTRKLDAFNPTFGGRITASGTGTNVFRGPIRIGNTTYPGYNGYISESNTDSQLNTSFARNLIGSTGATYTIANGELSSYSGFEIGTDIRWFAASGVFTTGQSVTPSELMRLKQGGNLLVGTSTDSGHRIQAAGNISATGTVFARLANTLLYEAQVYAANSSPSGTNGAVSQALFLSQPGYTTYIGTTGNGTVASYRVNSLGNVVQDQQGYLISDAARGLLIHSINGPTIFATQNSGSEKMRLQSDGTLLLKSDGVDGSNGRLQLATHTASSGGIGFGADVTLYRSAADILRTDDAFQAERVSGDNSASAILGVLNTSGAGVTNSFGIDARVIVNNSSGTTGSAIGLRALSRVSNASNVGAAIALVAQVDNPGAGTIATAYGLYVNPITVGANNYAIFTEGAAPSRFGGNVNLVGDLTVDKTEPTITFKRAANTNLNIVNFWTGAAADFGIGLRNTSDNDLHIYNYGTANDALKISKVDSLATFSGAITASGAITSSANVNSGVLQLNLVNSSTGTSASSLFRFNAGTRTASFQAYNDTHATLAGQLRIATSNGDITIVPSGVPQATFGPSSTTFSSGNVVLTDSSGSILCTGTGNTTASKVIQFTRSDNADVSAFGLTGSAYGGGLTGLGSNETYVYSSAPFRVFIGVAATNRFDFTSSQFKINATTLSNSTSSGALVVSGGVGIAGNTYIGGNLVVSGTITPSGGGGGGSTNVWIPASQWIPRTTTGCGVDSTQTTTNLQNFDELLFDPATIEYAQALVRMPSNYNNGTITARFFWSSSSGSGAVVWGLQARAFADDDALDTVFGTAQTTTDTLLATGDMHVSAATSAITIGGTPAATTPIQFQLYREATAGGDTLAVDARLLGVEISYTSV